MMSRRLSTYPVSTTGLTVRIFCSISFSLAWTSGLLNKSATPLLMPAKGPSQSLLRLHHIKRKNSEAPPTYPPGRFAALANGVADHAIEIESPKA